MISISVREKKNIWFGAAYDEPRVFGTTFEPNRQDALQVLLHSVPFDVPFQTLQPPSAFAERVLLTIEKVYYGKDASVDFSLATEHLSSFRRKVLDATFRIPVGYVTSYNQLAEATSGSPRAVGHVMATNPLAPIVPCQRVVAADFTLGGYGGGLKVKLKFLKRERRGYTSMQHIATADGTFSVFPVELVLDKLKDFYFE